MELREIGSQKKFVTDLLQCLLIGKDQTHIKLQKENERLQVELKRTVPQIKFDAGSYLQVQKELLQMNLGLSTLRIGILEQLVNLQNLLVDSTLGEKKMFIMKLREVRSRRELQELLMRQMAESDIDSMLEQRKELAEKLKENSLQKNS